MPILRLFSALRTTAVGTLALAATCGSPALAPSPPAPSATATTSATHFIDSLVAAQRLPGFAVTIGVGNAPIWRHAVGYANTASQTAATTSTQFRIGSVSKLLTATLLMRLAQTGRVDLDAPISHFVDVSPQLSGVTLRTLAGHLSGIRHYRGNEFLSNTHYDSLAAALGVFINDSLVATPGTRYAYSSYGYNLLGVAIERATHLPFTVAMRRTVLDPLALGATTEDDSRAIHPRRAALYMVSGDRIASVPDDDLSGRWPSGGYLSSSDDLALFARSTLAPGLLGAASLQTMLTPQHTTTGAATPVGVGWRVGSDSTFGTYYHHGGTSNGGSAFVLVLPARQMVIAMATNALAQLSERDALTLARRIIMP
ncbi:MAG TPA: serine hydrolase domain-containing protein [Gemmatimonadaceae bacterium]|jgi:CubicO group peptidase (beta-lactamase class C family)